MNAEKILRFILTIASKLLLCFLPICGNNFELVGNIPSLTHHEAWVCFHARTQDLFGGMLSPVTDILGEEEERILSHLPCPILPSILPCF